MSPTMFRPSDTDLLLRLMRIDTASPLETGRLPAVAEAQSLYADYARSLGFAVVHHAPPPPESLVGDDVPLPVRSAAERFGPAFLESQPNLVLSLGPPRPPERTVMFNFHMDTVSGTVPIGQTGTRITGRGAADMKGPGVALLSAVREALRRDARLADRVTILIQCPAGEEGGAMGIHGTRVLTDLGFVGALNVFAEPSGGVYFDRATCTMTARIEVLGEGSTDDDPAAGHNATILLGFLAQHLCEELADHVETHGGKLCIAGLHTGESHNRVYGAGQLLVNLAYGSADLGRQIGEWVETSATRGLAEFAARFARHALTRRTAREAHEILRVTWLKRGLPPLANRHAPLEQLLARTGLVRNPDDRPDRAFTCDAIWGQGPDRYAIVFGPGSLGANGCHTEREFIDLDDLDVYVGRVADVIGTFAASAGRSSEKEVGDVDHD